MRQKTELPVGKPIVKFKDFQKTEAHPFVIYCDFECALIPTDENDHIPNTTFAINTHEPSGFCLYTVSIEREFAHDPIHFSGPDCMNQFFDVLLEEQQRISYILDRNYQMVPLTPQQQEMYDSCTVCNYCKTEFTQSNYKVRNHSHRTGRYSSPACNRCNLQLKPSKRRRKGKDDSWDFHIPVIFHNLKNYDAHFIIKHFDRRLVRIGEEKFKNVNIIASSCEKFLSFDIHYLRSVDSVQFLSASLNT
jgi:uncharacterized CHY-type Zn-finger protein